MTIVNLHVGTFKTGTSYLQTVLASSKQQLAETGVLWPGRKWGDQVAATKGLLRGKRSSKVDAWNSLVDEVDAWHGNSVIISMETLSLASPEAVQRAAKAFSAHHVRVILTARDIGRVLPAQWQESVQNGKTWRYRDYLSAVVDGNAGDRAFDHFWSKHDWAHILRTWSQVAADADLVLVTVPPSGAPRGLLWERFSEAVGIDPAAYDAVHTVNESLGAASAEVMRNVSVALEARDFHSQIARVVKKTLAKSILTSRKKVEPTLVLPHALEEWVERRTEELIADLSTLSMSVVGDLADLRPVFPGPRPGETEDPSSLSADQLMETAGFAIAELCDILADNDLAPRGYGPDDSTPRRHRQRATES